MKTIIEKIRDLHLPLDQLVVIGSGVLEARGIRKAADVDVVLSESLWAGLESDGQWHRVIKDGRVIAKRGDEVEAGLQWAWWSFDDLKQQADEIEGILFASLQQVREFKVWRASDKDKADIQLIDTYTTER